jgi:hypothetical protein
MRFSFRSEISERRAGSGATVLLEKIARPVAFHPRRRAARNAHGRQNDIGPVREDGADPVASPALKIPAGAGEIP